MNTIAATTTRTGLRVRAELDTGAYDTGARVSDRQMEALPLARHDWHGNWNYTLHPQEYGQAAGVPDPFDQPSPDLAWLCHPALTSLPARDWNALTAALMKLHDQQREISLHKRRGYRPRLTVPAPAAGLPSPTDSWPPCCTSASPCPSRRRSLVQRPARKRSTSASATSASS